MLLGGGAPYSVWSAQVWKNGTIRRVKTAEDSRDDYALKAPKVPL
jgi:hypothetical protein